MPAGGGGGMGGANAYALVKGGQRIVAIADVDQSNGVIHVTDAAFTTKAG